jgi:hypothetical protein
LHFLGWFSVLFISLFFYTVWWILLNQLDVRILAFVMELDTRFNIGPKILRLSATYQENMGYLTHYGAYQLV